MSGTVFTGASYSDLEPALLSEFESARRKDPFGPVDILVGSNLLGVYLKRMLTGAAGELFNVRFSTFVDLISSLEVSSRRPPGPMLPAYGDRMIVSGLLDEQGLPAVFDGVSGTRGFGEALLATFTDLDEGGCSHDTAIDLLRDSGSAGVIRERLKGLFALYVRYRERVLEVGGDVHTRFSRAADLAGDIRNNTPLFVYGFYDFNELQWRLLGTLAAGQRVVLFVPWCEEEPYEFSRATIERLGREGFDIVQARPTGADRTGNVRKIVISAPGEVEEARAVVRRILDLAGTNGRRFNEIGVLLPSWEAYWPVLKSMLDEARVPYSAMRPSLADENRYARGALRLLGLLAGGIERGDLVDFLLSAPLSLPEGQSGLSDPFSLWVRKSAEAGMLGDSGWVVENGRFMELLLRADGDGGSSGEAAAARTVHKVLERLESGSGEFGARHSWSWFADRFTVLISDIFSESPRGKEVHGCIGKLAALDAISDEIPFEMFARIAGEALRAPRGHHGRLFGSGINVLPIGRARGLSFGTVFVLGCTESSLPGSVRQDPFLKDNERREIGTLTGGAVSLPEKIGRLEEEALLFVLAARSAREELFCSYPRFEEGTGREKMPSSYLRFIGWEGAGNCGVVEFMRITRHGERAGEGALLSPHEYDLVQAGAFADGAGALPENVFFSRGAALVEQRWGTGRFTSYDGVFASQRVLEELHAMLEKREWSFSPTSLERYARCPFAYFLGNILKIERMEEPERILSLTPLQRGSLVHELLALCYRAFRENGLLPLERSDGREVLGIAAGIVEGVLSRYPEREAVGLPVFWEIEKRLIAESVRLFLEDELDEAGEYEPVHFEKPFGGIGKGGTVEFETGNRSIRFHGRIDRIDLSADGRFRVIDYKTGTLRQKDQDMGGGAYLQLPVYLHAASRLLERPVTEGAAEYRRVWLGGRERVVFTGARWDSDGVELGRILDVIIDGIERGLFYAPSEDRLCTHCRLRPACPSGVGRLFKRKARRDRRCLDYLVLRGRD